MVINMLRTKDFHFIKVFDRQGQDIGFVKDIMIDFYEGKIKAFKLTSHSLLSKEINISVEDIIYINESIIVEATSNKEFISFNSIKHMDVIDREGNIIGIVEDMIIEGFNIKALIICPGFIYKLFKEKNIILLKDAILGEENILYTGKENSVKLKSIPRKVLRDKI